MEANEQKKQAESADSEATSDELLSDIEEKEAEVDSEGSDSGPGLSPDGALDEDGEIKDAGPM